MNIKLVELNKDEAHALSIRAEGEFFDRKALGIVPKKVQKIAVAFSNADGGEFVIGLADDRHEPNPEKRWAGAERTEQFNDILQSLFGLSPSIDFKYEFLTCPTQSGILLHVFVARATSLCKTSDNTIYQRQGASSVTITDPEKITALSFAKGASTFEDYPLTSVAPEIVVESMEAELFASEVVPR